MVYEPYGKIRYNYKAGSYGNDYTFTGKELDSETSLQYFGARYYSGIAGRFTSEDPIFLLLGSSEFKDRWENNWRNTQEKITDVFNDVAREQIDGQKKNVLQKYLANPQHLNSYSYVMNNPFVYVDPNGEREYHIGIGLNIGLGGELGVSFSFGFATDGTFGLTTTVNGGGLAGADASINLSAGSSDADTWSDTYGDGQYVTIGVV